jgi:hypothetical protein
LNYVNKNKCLADPNYFESEIPFLYDIKNLLKPSESFLIGNDTAWRRFALTGQLKTAS